MSIVPGRRVLQGVLESRALFMFPKGWVDATRCRKSTFATRIELPFTS